MVKILNNSYNVWKNQVSSQASPIYEKSDGYQSSIVWSGNKDYIFKTVVSAEDYLDLHSSFSTTEVLYEDDAITSIIGDLSEIPVTSKKIPRVQVDLREGSKLHIFSPNMCDKRTWFSDSTRKTSVVATDSGDGYIFNLPDEWIIDTCHGRISNEDAIHENYKVSVYVDGVEVQEHGPDTLMYLGGEEFNDWSLGNNDYGLDYENGIIIFKEDQSGKAITADYSFANSSKWYLTPSEGKSIQLMAAELQFSTGASLSSDFIFQGRGTVGKHPLLSVVLDDSSNPAKISLVQNYTWDGTTTVSCADTSEVSVGEWISLDGSGAWYLISQVNASDIVIQDALNIGMIPSGSTPSAKSSIALFPAGTKLPLGEPTKYKTKMDIINEANISYPRISKDDGYQLSWRSLPSDVEIFRWDYAKQAVVQIKDSWGMDIEISLQDDVPAHGDVAVVTFYGLSEDE